MFLCSQCGGTNKEEARFCRFCGNPMFDPDPNSQRLPLGTILDERYKIIDYIAKGGMGAVYKAVDMVKSGIWAVKEMLDYFDSREEREYAVERFSTEAQILYNLNHKSIPTLIDCFLSGHRYYLIMEYIEGRDLREIIDEAIENGHTGVDEKQVIHWSIQICEVLEYLHSQNPPIIYRDLKPGNIMINRDSKVFIVDFGIARIFDPRTKATMVGTQGYAPPEQYRGEAEPRSDMYSLAACMHHLLTGKDPKNDIPFNFPPLKSLRKDLSEEIDEIITKALSMEPEDRFPNITKMKDALIALKYSLPGEKQGEVFVADTNISTFQDTENIQELTGKETQIIKSSSDLSRWYMFRGDSQQSARSCFGEEVQGKIRWRFDAKSPVRSSVAVDNDGSIYFGSNSGCVYALNSQGNLRWKYITGARVLSSPLITRNGLLIIGSNDCFIHAVDLGGMPAWKFNTHGRIRCSPCLSEDGTIYVGSNDHYLYAIQLDGNLKWKINLKGKVESTPIISDKGVIFASSWDPRSGNSFVHKLDSGGNIIWHLKLKTRVNSSPAMDSRGRLYIGGSDGLIYCLTQDGALKWRFRSRGEIVASPLIDNLNRIIFGSKDKNIYSLNSEGKMEWTFATGSSVNSSPVLAAGKTIIVGSDDYKIYALSCEGNPLWEIKCGARVRSTASISKDGIYIGCDDGLMYAIA